MTFWLTPFNPKQFDVESCIQKHNLVYWQQKKNYEKGDVVFLYASGKLKMIQYVMGVEEVGLENTPKIIELEKEYWKEGKTTAKQFCKFVLAKKLNGKGLSLKDLQKNGLKSNLQSSIKIKDKLLDYIKKHLGESTMSILNETQSVVYPASVPENYRLFGKNEEQIKASFIYFMGDKNATTKQIKNVEASNYPRIGNNSIICSIVKDLYGFENIYKITDVDKIKSIDQQMTQLRDNAESKKDEKELSNQRSYIRKYIEFLNYCNSLLKITTTKSIYSFAEDSERPFINEEKFKELVDLLSRKKNVILEGAPGVGKTFLARKVAYQLMGEIKDDNIEMVQFHQSYNYEDFVQGIRPMPNGEFKTRDGVFYEFCAKAQTAPNEKFVFIIDEINRGNLSKILGELMMLIEANKRAPKYAIKLTYTDPDGEKFYVPDNVYILGCMNTADRSLAIVDYALRRRFAFFPIEPEFNQAFRDYLSQNFAPTFVDEVCKRLEAVNKRIQQEPSLGSGMEIGHSYFCDITGANDETKWWKNICKYELFPYIREICFDNNDLADDLCKELTM